MLCHAFAWTAADFSITGKCPCGPGKEKKAKGPKAGNPPRKGGCSSHNDCKGSFCMKEDKLSEGFCQPCTECHYPHDGIDGKCGPSCTPTKGQSMPNKGGGDGDDAGGPGAECAKHKDCPKTDFCSQEGCRKCKQCEEGASSAQARAESSGPLICCSPAPAPLAADRCKPTPLLNLWS